MEAASRLAEKLGKKTEAGRWMADSKTLLEKILKNFWNGEKFICRIAGTNEIVDTESIAMYQPLILGNRLPAEVIEKMAAKLGDPAHFLTKEGLASESRQSPFYTIGTSFMLGRILSYVQLILVTGLYNSGKKDLAKKIAGIYCDFTLKAGLVAMVRNDDLPANDPLAIVKPSVPGNGWSSWSSAIFLVLCRMLKEG
jgi:glycogen debranching enzyme